MTHLNIPVGISDFAEIRQNGYYYVDKTGLIAEVLKAQAVKVTLITRPRRFGKTLGMSTLENFFSIRKDSAVLFQGLGKFMITGKIQNCCESLSKRPHNLS